MSRMVFRPKFRITKAEAEYLIKAGYTPVIRWVRKRAKGRREYLTTKEAKAESALN
jgi:hypothetical protein